MGSSRTWCFISYREVYVFLHADEVTFATWQQSDSVSGRIYWEGVVQFKTATNREGATRRIGGKGMAVPAAGDPMARIADGLDVTRRRAGPWTRGVMVLPYLRTPARTLEEE